MSTVGRKRHVPVQSKPALFMHSRMLGVEIVNISNRYHYDKCVAMRTEGDDQMWPIGL